MTITLDLAAFLSERGYRKYEQNNSKCLWQSRRDFLPLCASNEKSWINVWVYHNDADPPCEIEIRAEAPDGTWFKLLAYSFHATDLPAKLAGIEQRLIAAWKAVAEPTP